MSSWLTHAACKHQLPTFMLLGITKTKYERSEYLQERAAHAIAICRRCPVLHQCRRDLNEEGGYSEIIAAGLLPWEQPPRRTYEVIAVGKKTA
jgi:hypothetical protein